MVHKNLRICDRHDKSIIRTVVSGVKNIFIYLMKKMRGIGGIFFDYKKDN